MNKEQRVRINSLKLAYETFQSCRYVGDETEWLVEALIPVLNKACACETWVVDVPGSLISGIDPHIKAEIVCRRWTGRFWRRRLQTQSRHLLLLCSLAAQEFKRLLHNKEYGATRSLGYALHIVPRLIQCGEVLDHGRYEFCFATAAFHWSVLSLDMQKALAEAAGFDLDEAYVYANDDAFVVDLFGEGREGEPETDFGGTQLEDDLDTIPGIVSLVRQDDIVVYIEKIDLYCYFDPKTILNHYPISDPYAAPGLAVMVALEDAALLVCLSPNDLAFEPDRSETGLGEGVSLLGDLVPELVGYSEMVETLDELESDIGFQRDPRRLTDALILCYFFLKGAERIGLEVDDLMIRWDRLKAKIG